MKDKKVLVSKVVIDFMAIGIFFIFGGVVATAMYIAVGQISHNAEYGAESFGLMNNIIVFGLGAFFNSILSQIFGIDNKEMHDALEQSVKVSKEVGALAFAEKEQSAEEPNDNE